MPVADPETGEVAERRCIDLVDATLADQARRFSVPEFTRIADRLVQNLNPPEPGDAHRRRYLHLSRLADGSVRGRFAFGPAQALTLTAVLAALAEPRPGRAVDADGVEHDLPDERDPAQRRADALIEAIDHNHETCHCRHGETTEKDSRCAPDTHATDGHGKHVPDAGAIDGREQENEDCDIDDRQSEDPDIEELGTEDLDAGYADPDFAVDPPPGEGEFEIRRSPGMRFGPYPQIEIIVTATLEQLARPHDQRGGFAHVQHAAGVHPTVLGLLACNGRLRRLLLDDHGAVLHLGRGVRLATAAQRYALYGRDIGCVIPGCGVPGDLCEVHHVVAWADGGPTDIDNLVLTCPRHHIEITDGTWGIEMIDGVPWVRPPAWVDPTRPLLRNTTHQPHGTAA